MGLKLRFSFKCAMFDYQKVYVSKQPNHALILSPAAPKFRSYAASQFYKHPCMECKIPSITS